jgi:hypothetical protein
MRIATSLSLAATVGCDKATRQNEADGGLEEEKREVPKESEMEVEATIFKDEYKESPTGLSPAALAGRWYGQDEYFTEIWDFNPDSAMMNDWPDNEEWNDEGFWQVDGNLLAREFWNYEEYEGDYGEPLMLKWKNESVTTAAIVDDIVYFDVIAPVILLLMTEHP